MITPEGYSVLFLDPFMFSNKYCMLEGEAIDSDHFNINMDNAQIIFYPKVNHSFTTEGGTSCACTNLSFQEGRMNIYILLSRCRRATWTTCNTS